MKYNFNKDKFFEKVGYEPHKGQNKFHKSKARFRVLTCGRRWGKSKSTAMEASAALMKKTNQLGWIVAPTYDLSEKIFREVYWTYHKCLPYMVESSSLSRADMHIKLKNGSHLIAKSADNPTSLIGEGLDFLIIDEASRVKGSVWHEALRPTLGDKQGWAIFISTPKGKNWFYELFRRGAEGEKDYESWHFSSYTNPYLPKEEIEQAKKTSPKFTFIQEWLAEFLESKDSYFKYSVIVSCIDESIKFISKRRHPTYKYYLGVDCARMGEDESVLTILECANGKNKVVHIESFETNTTTELAGRVKYLDVLFKFNKIFVDMNGLGSGVYDIINDSVPGRVKGNKFTASDKQDIYSNLTIQMENNNILYPNHRKLIEQLKDLRYNSKDGAETIKIHHSRYGFDDYPDSLALAAQGIKIRDYTPCIA